MKGLLRTARVLVVATTMTGCASVKAYWVDRGRDAADVFTATVGYGMGVKGRFGVLHAGVYAGCDKWGLRGGEFSWLSRGELDTNPSGDLELPFFVPVPSESPTPVSCSEGYEPDGIPAKRRKGYFAYSECLPFLTAFWNSSRKHGAFLERDRDYFHPYFTQIEVIMGVGGSIRLGVNPGEFVDFLLGWVGIDIFRDDVEEGAR